MPHTHKAENYAPQRLMKHPFLYGAHHAGRFQDQSVVDRYHLRPAYPPETFTVLNELIADEPRVILDLGCGTGNIARPLAAYETVERIDAVDLSLPMIERGKTLPGGDSPKIRWRHGRAEDVELNLPYALVTAGESLHWMTWDVVLPRLARVLTPHGVLAIAYMHEKSMPWSMGAKRIEQRFTTILPIGRLIGSPHWSKQACSNDWASVRPRRWLSNKRLRTTSRASMRAARFRLTP